MELTPGGPDDTGTLLDMFDARVAWMVARGQPDQWGSAPWSADPAKAERVRGMASGGGLWLARIDGVPAGALVVSDEHASYVPPAEEPELYVVLLITMPEFAGRGVGRALLDHARTLAVERGVGLMRIDCWAGREGALVRYYTRAGFTPTETFHVGDWPGQVLEQRLPG